jgi:hypothetical protein
MAKTSLEMIGPYDLTTNMIYEIVTRTSAGNYALGYLNAENVFIVKYVGRSDSNLNARLLQHIGEGYKKFKYSYAQNSKEAFEKECKNYHDFGASESLDNKIHPDRPADKDWKCPYCNNF